MYIKGKPSECQKTQMDHLQKKKKLLTQEKHSIQREHMSC